MTYIIGLFALFFIVSFIFVYTCTIVFVKLGVIPNVKMSDLIPIKKDTTSRVEDKNDSNTDDVSLPEIIDPIAKLYISNEILSDVTKKVMLKSIETISNWQARNFENYISKSAIHKRRGRPKNVARHVVVHKYYEIEPYETIKQSAELKKTPREGIDIFSDIYENPLKNEENKNATIH